MIATVLAEGPEWTHAEIVRMCQEEPVLSVGPDGFMMAMSHALQQVFCPLVERLLWNGVDGRLTCFTRLEPDPILIDAIRATLTAGFMTKAVAMAKREERIL